ncbi:MAG: host specificity factor TipJ family phage tail protein [Pseudomonadota bacterium]
MHESQIIAPLQPPQTFQVSSIARPFSSEPTFVELGEGLSIAEILDIVQPDPVLRRHVNVYVGDCYINPDYYHVVRPKNGSLVTMRVVPRGGGGGGKNPIATVLLVAVVIVATIFGQYYVGPLVAGAAGSAAAGTAAGIAATAAIAVAGSLLVNAIFPVRPPSLPSLSGQGQSADSPTAFIEGARNSLRPFDVVPVVLGRHRQVPPYGAPPYTESLGRNQYVRMLFVWGAGPLQIEDIKIGETPIEEYDEVEIETRQGYADDEPISIYSNDVAQEDLSLQLFSADSWQSRTTETEADEIGIDISLPNGLFQLDNRGQRQQQAVTVEVQYRKVGDTVWIDIPGDATISFNPEWIVPPRVAFIHLSTAAIRHGITWKVAERGQYEIQVRRLTPDTDNDRIVDAVWWTAIRRFKNEPPIKSEVPLAMSALRIRATDQLNNVVDELNGVCTSIAPDWDGSAWVERPTRNNASLLRLALQGRGISKALPDTRIDIPGLQDFHDFCRVNGFTFDMVRDFSSSVWSVLSDICGAGRSSPTQRDGKWSVVTDEQQAYPVQHFTPRNSVGFQSEKALPDFPHALRIRFLNENEGWRNDERIVYDDGYDETNATIFEGVEIGGVTNPDNIYKFGRFHIRQGKLRPERWSLTVDIEHLVARRGSLVRVTHDVLVVGLGSGRITAITEDTNGDVVSVKIDETLEMEEAKLYGVSIRTPGNAGVVSGVETVAGGVNELIFTNPIAADTAPAVGDLFGFGELGAETADALVLSIAPQSDFRATLLLVPQQNSVYDEGTIPPFETNITPLPVIPAPEILALRSDETALALVGSTLEVRVEADVVPLREPLLEAGFNLDVQIRPSVTGEPYTDADVLSKRQNGVTITGLPQGDTYDFRFRWRVQDRLPGPWTEIFNHRIVGNSSPPQALQGLTLSIHGGTALMRWESPPEIDVRFGGTVQWRHSPALIGATWAASTSIGTVANADALIAPLPLKPGTYLARVYDRVGNPSDDIVSITTKQASIIQFANVGTVTEHPTFTGAKTDVVESGGILKLDSQGNFDSIADFDAIDNLDALGGLVESGVYDFAAGLDLADTISAVKRVRLTSRVVANSVNELSLIDSRGDPIDEWEDFDGDVQGAADAQVWVRFTDDDPLSTAPDWSDWVRLDSGEFEARAFEFQARLSTTDSSHNINITELSVTAEEII